MLDNCLYDKIKLLHKTSCILWFIKKHGLAEEKESGHAECATIYQSMIKDLEKHVAELKKAVCQMCKE